MAKSFYLNSYLSFDFKVRRALFFMTQRATLNNCNTRQITSNHNEIYNLSGEAFFYHMIIFSIKDLTQSHIAIINVCLNLIQ